jgi:hypothetical protein
LITYRQTEACFVFVDKFSREFVANKGFLYINESSFEENSLENLSKTSHPYDTLYTLLNRVRAKCLSAF